jgi:undecaprenyl-diphosphatase
MEYLIALLLGLVEGLTEYLPVSSTAHLLLLGHFLGFESKGKVFEVAIQLGAVLAMLTLYFQRLWGVAKTLPHSPQSRGFVITIVIAFLPAALIGLMAHDIIKTVLFESPRLIATTLIIGGIMLYVVDKYAPTPKHHDAMSLDFKTALMIGLFQCMALVPGMSRSGSTLMGAMIFRVDKRAAAEFSFFLAMPTMAAAVGYDLLKSAQVLNPHDLGLIGVGFAAAFLSAALVIKTVLDFVSRHGFGLFAIWRIVTGSVVLILLSL